MTASQRQKEMQEALNRASVAMAGASPEDIFPVVSQELASIGFSLDIFTLDGRTVDLPHVSGKGPRAAEAVDVFRHPVQRFRARRGPNKGVPPGGPTAGKPFSSRIVAGSLPPVSGAAASGSRYS